MTKIQKGNANFLQLTQAPSEWGKNAPKGIKKI
jgi:hypothetical protein